MSLHQRNMLSYLNYLKSRHPLVRSLLAILNIFRFTQIPVEMVLHRFFSQNIQRTFVLTIELAKFVVKFGVWQGSGWRAVPKNLYVSFEGHRDSSVMEADEQGVEDDALKRLERRMRQLDLLIRDNASQKPSRTVQAYLKGHKRDIYTENPQLTFSPAVGSWIEWSRELAHIARPAVYISLIVLLGSPAPQSTLRKWLPLLTSLSLDLYAKWPELSGVQDKQERESVLESEEKSRRLLEFFYYFLRQPVYDAVSSPALDSIQTKLNERMLLKPLGETLRIYRKLCKDVYFYTSAS